MASKPTLEWKFDHPDYVTVRYSQDLLGIVGEVFDWRVDGYIHLLDDPKDGYITHSWSSSCVFTEKPTKKQLQNIIDQIPKRLSEVADWYTEYDYDDEGEVIPGTECKIYFDEVMLVCKSGRIDHRITPKRTTQ